MTINLTAGRAAVLFASELSATEPHSRAEIRAAIAGTVRLRHGVHECADLVAYEYGRHPAEAAQRMRWALNTVRPATPHHQWRAAA